MKYYKITNEDECHHGMQYKTGLNVDILPFNPSGDCENGGIYFASEDILSFFGFGVWIREVTLPKGEEVYRNPGNPIKYKAHQVILGERQRLDDPKVFKKLLKQFDPSDYGNYVICSASENGRTNIVKLLLKDKRVNPTLFENYALRCASENGNLEVVKLLLKDKRVDPSDHNNAAIRSASANGHIEVVKILLKDKRVDPSAYGNSALQVAVSKRYLEIVKLLLKDERVDPSVCDDEQMRCPNLKGYPEMIKLLENGKNGKNVKE